MKLATSSITDTAKRLFKKKSARTARLITPARDWYIGVCIGILILVLMAAWSAYMYWAYRTVDTVAAQELELQPVPTYKAAIVESALEQYEIRTQRFNDLQRTQLVSPPEPIVEESENIVETEPVTIAASSTVAESEISIEEEGQSSESLDALLVPSTEPLQGS